MSIISVFANKLKYNYMKLMFFFCIFVDTEEIFNQPPQPQTNDSEGETEEGRC